MSLDATATLTSPNGTVASILVSESRSITYAMFDSIANAYPDAVQREADGTPVSASLDTGAAHAILQRWKADGTFGYEASALAFAIDRMIATVQGGATMTLVAE